ncbi:Lipase [Cordylochernes scorpioides]|uniref:Lipase n=1 Tax=Cordylochernes scorpioides TaxID=51811 RepID=A0ABY6KP75_9ARAC|nr:Lipase [Cordylochernes scorpioides]
MTEESILASPFNSSKPSIFIIHGYLDNRKFGPWMDTVPGLDPSQPEFRGMPPRVRLDRGDAYFVDIIHTSTTNLRLLNFGKYSAHRANRLAMIGPQVMVSGSRLATRTSTLTAGPINQAVQSGAPWIMPSLEGSWQVGDERAVASTVLTTTGTGGRQLFSCSHQRAHVYFIESLDHERCTPTAITCPSYADYQAGRCGNCGPDGSRCAIMGMRAIESKAFMRENSSNVYYLNMDSTSTHCRESHHNFGRNFISNP